MINETVATFAHLETEWDQEKLEKKINEYFNKASKGIDFNRGLQEVLDEYAGNALSSMFASLGDREWLYGGGVDFSLVLMAGAKDAIPASLLNTVEQEVFEQMVMQAHAVRYEDQRFGPILSEAVGNHISGPKIKKKVWTAFDEGRKSAFASGAETLDDFTTAWINSTLTQLAQEWGDLTSFLEETVAVALFHALITANALPLSMVAENPPPEGYPLVDVLVAAVYAAAADGTLPQPPPKKKQKNW